MDTDPRESFEDETARRMCELQAFLDKWKDLPAQRTQQWYDDRTYSIGASEIPTLLGELLKKKINPYQTVRSLVAGKCGLTKIDDKTAMNWGTVLENVVKMVTELVFACKIEEMGSVPTAGMRAQRSSPDGVGVVPCLGNKIVSFEFKAPKNRIPKGMVPPYYKPQVLTCLCAVEPSDVGIFVDCVIRRCAVADWRFDSPCYDLEYHKDIDMGLPVALGVLYFYREASTPAAMVSESEDVKCGDTPLSEEIIAIVNQYINGRPAPIDLGTCEPALFDSIFAQTTAHELRVEYHPIIVDSGVPPDWVTETAGRNDCVAIMPFKIMKLVVVPVLKEPGYILKFQPLVDQIVGTVRKVLAVPEDERPELFNQLCNAEGWTEMPYSFAPRGVKK